MAENDQDRSTDRLAGYAALIECPSINRHFWSLSEVKKRGSGDSEWEVLNFHHQVLSTIS